MFPKTKLRKTCFQACFSQLKTCSHRAFSNIWDLRVSRHSMQLLALLDLSQENSLLVILNILKVSWGLSPSPSCKCPAQSYYSSNMRRNILILYFVANSAHKNNISDNLVHNKEDERREQCLPKRFVVQGQSAARRVGRVLTPV